MSLQMTWHRLLLVVLALAAGTPLAHGDPPVASYIFPPGGQRGKNVDFRVGGLFLHQSCSFEMLGAGVTASKRLERTNTVWFEGPLLALPESQQAEDYPKDLAGRVEIAAQAPIGVRHWRLWNAQGATPAMQFMVGDLPEVVEQEVEGNPIPVEVRLPVTINGRIFPRENVDIWSFAAHKGQVISCEVYAARLGSPLDSRLEVRDPNGRRIAENDDAFGADSFIRFTAPEDGKYQVRIHDINFRGGQAYVYRLTLAAGLSPSPVPGEPKLRRTGSVTSSTPGRSGLQQAPDFHLRLHSDALAINRGDQGKLKILAERQGGFTEPILLAVEGLPVGVTAAPVKIEPKQQDAEITFKVAPQASIQGSHLTINGSAMIGNRRVSRPATLSTAAGPSEVDNVLLAVTLPTPFKIVGDFEMSWAPRGTVYHRHYRIKRGGFSGPLEISLADRQARHLQGVSGPTIIVPPGADEFDYPFHLPPWLETARTARACIMAVGKVKESDGREHVVSFSSAEQNEQMIAVIEPGRLGLEAERLTLIAEAGKTVAIPIRVIRSKHLSGPVKLELIVASHMRGISAESVTVPAEQSSASLPIRFASKSPGPWNAPLVIRATAFDKGEPVVAEAKIEVQPFDGF
jgi:hypothetical protein